MSRHDIVPSPQETNTPDEPDTHVLIFKDGCPQCHSMYECMTCWHSRMLRIFDVECAAMDAAGQEGGGE